MSSYVQLLSIIFSIFFGILFSLLTILNFKIINNLKKLWKHIITLIYVFDMIIIYIIIIYKLNNGYFHLYFIIMVVISYFVGLCIYNLITSKFCVNRHFSKLKK